MQRFRAFVVAACLLWAVVACHHARRPLIRVEVFEDHVSIDGTRSEMTLQQAVDSQTRSHKGIVILLPREPLSTGRVKEIIRIDEKLYPGIGIKRVCFPGEAPGCR